MATMTRRPLRIVPAPHSRIVGDEPVEVVHDPADTAEPFGDGRWAVHDAAGHAAGHAARREHWAIVGARGRRHDGIETMEVVVNGWRFDLEIDDAQHAALRERAGREDEVAGAGGPLEVRAIIPGRIVVVAVETGSEVTVGQRLLVVEAMKMQNELRAPRAGTVERVAAIVGKTVDLGDLLVVIS